MEGTTGHIMAYTGVTAGNCAYHPYGKHRGKCLKTGEWVEGYLWRNANHVYIIPVNLSTKVTALATEGKYQFTSCAYEVDPYTVGAYTFIEDKNQKAIYHGDIVTKGFNRYAVLYNKEQAKYDLYTMNGICVAGFNKDTSPFLEVIGTIYD